MENSYNFYGRKNEIHGLLNAFKQKVIKKQNTLGFIIRGRRKIGKTRLIEEFVEKLQDVEFLCEIPKFNIKKNVIRYKCSKNDNIPYEAFLKITKDIYKQTILVNIFIKFLRVGLAVFGINDILEALNDFVNSIKNEGNDNKIYIKEAKLFNKYRKFIKNKSHKTPLIFFIQNAQWLDKYSLTLIKKLIENKNSMWGMIILEEDDEDINEKVHIKINNLIYNGKLDKLEINTLDQSFIEKLLEKRFGRGFFSTRELDLLFAISEGCPGKLIDFIERTCIPQGWIKQKNNEWIKTDNFFEKIKPAKQKLLEVIITFFEDKMLSKTEYNTILRMASVWDIDREIVKSTISMISEIVDFDYKIVSDLGPGIISENSFLVYDTKDHRYIIEYVKNYNIETKDKKLERRPIIHKNLLEAHNIKISKEGILLIWDYFESNPNRSEMIEAFENQINYNIEKFKAIGEGLSELHRHNIYHGYIKPETIIENKNGEFQLATFDNILLKYVFNINYENYHEIQYLSPEHLKNEKILMSSDIFSLGVLLYKSLTNQFPYHGNTKNELLYSFENDEVLFNGPFLTFIPIELKNIIKKCLEFDNNKRYKTAMELNIDLKKIQLIKNKQDENIDKNDEKKDDEEDNIGKSKKNLKLFSVIILTLAILFSGFYYFGIFKKKTKSIKNEIVIHVAIKNYTPNESSKIKPDVIQYLIMDDLMQSSNAVVKTQQQFDKSYPDTKDVNFIPAIKVNAIITNRDYSHELEISVTINNKSKTIKKSKTIDFTDPSELLEGKINNITKFILGKNKLRKTTFTNSWDSFVNFYKGEIAWSKVDQNKALRFLNNAVSIDSNFILAKLNLAEIYRFEGNNNLSKKNLESVLPYTKYLSRVDSLKAMALKNKLNGDFWSAIKNLRDITQYLSARKEPYYNLAEAYFEIRDIKNAKVNYQKALDLDPDFIPAINHYAYCFTQTGEHKIGLKYFRKYLKLDSSANAFDSFGDGLMAAGLLDSAEWAKKQGLNLGPKLEYLYNSLSYIQIRKGEFDSAEINVNHYLRLKHEPELHAEGLVNKALIYYFKNDLKIALDTCRKAISTFDTFDIATRNHKAHWLLTQIYLYQGDSIKANKELTKMKNLINNYHISTTNYNEILKYYYHCKAIKYALNKQFNEVFKIANIFDSQLKDKIKDWDSPYGQAFFFTEFGKLFLMNNNYKDAEYYLGDALAYNPNYALAHYYFYKLFLKQKKYHKALLHGNIFLKLWSNADKDIIKIKDTIKVQGFIIPDIEIKTNYNTLRKLYQESN